MNENVSEAKQETFSNCSWLLFFLFNWMIKFLNTLLTTQQSLPASCPGCSSASFFIQGSDFGPIISRWIVPEKWDFISLLARRLQPCKFPQKARIDEAASTFARNWIKVIEYGAFILFYFFYWQTCKIFWWKSHPATGMLSKVTAQRYNNKGISIKSIPLDNKTPCSRARLPLPAHTLL